MPKKKQVRVLQNEYDSQEEENYFYGSDFNITKAAHPITCVFHFLFKVGAGLR